MRAAWIGDLDYFAVLLTIRSKIRRRDCDIGSLSFGFCRIHSQAPVPLLDHRLVSLSIRSESHHQLWNTFR